MQHPSARDIQDFIQRSLTGGDGGPFVTIDHVEPGRARLRLQSKPSHLRPGGSVSGPIQMALADTAAWALLLHNLGFVAAPSVTSSLNISFLSRPDPGDLSCEATLLKLGARLSVTEVRLFGADGTAPCAHATVTYAVITGDGARKRASS